MISRILFFCTLFSLLCLFYACGATSGKPIQEAASPYPLELKWVRKSVEYDLLCIQIYRDAWQAVKAAVAKTQEPWTIVMDVDETVLDNSEYQEILWKKNKSYPYYWDEWIRSKNCTAIPGAGTFLDSLRTLGSSANVVFITNRTSTADSETRENLISAGLWRDGDLVMGKRDKTDSKEVRRKEVLNGSTRSENFPPRQIIALFGDQLGDFVEYEYTTLEALTKTEASKSEYGAKFFILPNPLYGYWERDYK